MVKQNRGLDISSFAQTVGGIALLMLVITVGALVPLKFVEIVFGYPVFQEMSDFAREPYEDVKTRRNNP